MSSSVDPASLPVSLATQDAIEEALRSFQEGAPGSEGVLHGRISDLVRRQLSTRAVGYLLDLCDRLPDAGLRAMVAKRAYELRRDYLASYKEFSDRALILLMEREGVAAQWEAIYLLGCFGGEGARKYLQQRLSEGLEIPLREAAQRAIQKIGRRSEEQRRERGF